MLRVCAVLDRLLGWNVTVERMCLRIGIDRVVLVLTVLLLGRRRRNGLHGEPHALHARCPACVSQLDGAEVSNMLYWAAVFFVIALVAAVLGFGGVAAGAAGIAKVLFFVFLVLGALSLIFGRRVPA
jgi:uncharacterized membrane protein YtjA (UPF0391 family)